MYVDVAIPVKFKDTLTYSVPEEMRQLIELGSVVKVHIVNRPYNAIVVGIKDTPDINIPRIRPISSVVNLPPITQTNLEFLKQIAAYYMCSMGDVLKFAAPSNIKALKRPPKEKAHKNAEEPNAGKAEPGAEATPNTEAEPGAEAAPNAEAEPGAEATPNAEAEPQRVTAECLGVAEAEPGAEAKPNVTAAQVSADIIAQEKLPVLSEEQTSALQHIRAMFETGKNVLLHGVTGSGKTEIYISLAAECLNNGKSVLYLVPEVAISKQIHQRLSEYFADSLQVYHSKRTAVQRREVYEAITHNSRPQIILGLRSALLLPYKELGLIIVDEEHDSSYKQSDPAPRYHGRDAALMLGRAMCCPVLLGSATPSFESLYNVSTGRLALATLQHKYFGSDLSYVTIVDMPKERRKNAVKGSFSLTLIKAIEQRIKKGEQVLIFRSRRAYASAAECTACGDILRCPHCNIPLSYHKFRNSLSCHYCGYSVPFTQVCPKCNSIGIKLLGDGTEKVEEELKTLFPNARIARYDADIADDRKEAARTLKDFAAGKTDILVGTQMISKGFDFKNLTLTAVLKAETITQVFDFRADERALQLLRQLMGRAGRREVPGEIIIQTGQASHPVLNMLLHPEESDFNQLLEERRQFNYPPFTRLIRITVKSPDKEKVARLAAAVRKTAIELGFPYISGPVPPIVETVSGEHLLQLIIRIDRKNIWGTRKTLLYEKLRHISYSELTIDVDPVGL